MAARPCPPHAEAKLQRQAEAAAASSSEVLQQRVADLEERLRWVGLLHHVSVVCLLCACCLRMQLLAACGRAVGGRH